MSRGVLRRLLATWVGAAGALIVAAPSVLAGADSHTFQFNENATWTVPEGITEVTIQVAGGGGGGMDGRRGGNGASVEVEVAVAPGQTFTQVASGAGLNAAPGATFTVGVGGGGKACSPGGCSIGGAGGGGGSIVRGPGSNLSTISLLIIAGGGGGAGLVANGGVAGQADGSGGDGGGGLAGAGGAGGIGGASGHPYPNAQNFVLDNATNTGRGRGGADVGGAGSIGGHTANQGGHGGAGFGGGGVGAYPSTSSHLSSSGGAGGSTAQGSVVLLGSASYSSLGGAGGTSGANGENGWVTITWVISPPPVVGGRNSSAMGSPVTLNFTMPTGLSCTAPQLDRTGSWVQVPTERDCVMAPGARSLPHTGLLGWATAPDFPVEIAQRQIDNNWGAYELMDGAGDLAAVFIPAGGWTQVSADTTLFPIWVNSPEP